jgi:hypothetical protein
MCGRTGTGECAHRMTNAWDGAQAGCQIDKSHRQSIQIVYAGRAFESKHVGLNMTQCTLCLSAGVYGHRHPCPACPLRRPVCIHCNTGAPLPEPGFGQISSCTYVHTRAIWRAKAHKPRVQLCNSVVPARPSQCLAPVYKATLNNLRHRHCSACVLGDVDGCWCSKMGRM